MSLSNLRAFVFYWYGTVNVYQAVITQLVGVTS